MQVREKIQVKIRGQIIEIEKDTTLLELSREYQKNFKYPIILAKVGGIYHELRDSLTKNCEVEFLDLTDRFANRIYINGLIYLTLYAGKELYGNSVALRVLHSIDKGLYIEATTTLTEGKVKELETKMREIVDRNMDIVKMNVTRLDAIHYFNSINDIAKRDIMKYNTNTYVTLYKLGNMYSYFYSLMPIATEVFTTFQLTYLNPSGFILQFPTIYEEGIKEYIHRPKIFEVFKEYREWEHVMHLENVSELNKKVAMGSISDIIRIDETLQNNRLLTIAREIESKKDKLKIILIAGPSSSGKTTTTRKLSMYLRSFGMNPLTISMDDYFKERKDTPKDQNGEYNFETIDALDLDLFNKQIASLLNHEEVLIPTFNFLLGMKEYKTKLKLEENDLLLIEGIHGLNPEILNNIPKESKCRIYLSPLTALNLDNQNRISTTDNRLLRRIIRDNRTRGYKVEETLKSWKKVREGEEKYIFPYQDDADFTFNTALIYELGVLKTYVEPLLYSVEASSPYYEEAKRLINFLRVFLPIPSEDIPDDSILREFIGRSCFHD